MFTSQIYIQVLSMFYSPFRYDFLLKLCFLFSIKGVLNSLERHVPKQLGGVCHAAWKFQAFKRVIESLTHTMIKEKRCTRNDFRERADFQSKETVYEV